MQKGKILITCPKGVPPFLKQELADLGFPFTAESVAGVETEGSIDDTLRLNLFLRTGHRVLYQLTECSAADADALYRAVNAIPWEDHIPADGYLCVTSSVDTSGIRDTRFASLKCKDAIVDRIRRQKGKRPDSGPERDRSVVHLYWKADRCVLYLDTSGEPLSRRGYRKIPLAAPMQETLAAAVVLATGWDGRDTFINPMCGSGTLAIEAALIGLGRPAGLLRSNFGFMHLLGFNEPLWRGVREDAQRRGRKHLPGKIIATDINPDAVEAARKNATTAGVEHLIDFRACDYAETPVPEGGGVVVMNPEYGERMGDAGELEAVYKGIGDFLKQKCRGYRGYVFTGNAGLAKKVGLKPGRAIPFFNSGIECRLLEYELYEGSRKAKKGTSGAP
jgi:putative N6-adenine-specific DNA methylase